MAKIMGFDNNLYGNGLRCLDARFVESPYYSSDLAKRFADGEDCSGLSEYERQHKAQIWFKRSLLVMQQSSFEGEDYMDYVYDYINFLEKINDTEEIARVRAIYMYKSE